MAYAEASTEPKQNVGVESPSTDPSQKTHIGWIENAGITLQGVDGKERTIVLSAKVDTGANTSSLHARGIKIVSRNGREIARFTFDWGTVKFESEAPLQKEKRVKSSDGESEERQFIEVEMCVGNRKGRLLVSLNDRGTMRYPLILGRHYLENDFLVDPKNQFLLGNPNCR